MKTAADLEVDRRIPLDLDRIERLGDADRHRQIELDLDLPAGADPRDLVKAEDAPGGDAVGLPGGQDRLDRLRDLVGRDTQAERDHRRGLRETHVAELAGGDATLELLFGQAGSHFRAQRAAAFRSVDHADDFQLLDPHARAGGGEREPVHYESGVDAGAQHRDAVGFDLRVEGACERGVTQVGERELLARRNDVEARGDRLFDLRCDRLEAGSRAEKDDVALCPGGGGLLVELPGGRRDRERRAPAFEARHEAADAVHVGAIIVAETGDKILFLDSGAGEKEREPHDAARDHALKAFQLLLRHMELFVVLCTSGSGGWHLFAFTRQLHPVEDWIRLLKQVAAMIGAAEANDAYYGIVIKNGAHEGLHFNYDGEGSTSGSPSRGGSTAERSAIIPVGVASSLWPARSSSSAARSWCPGTQTVQATTPASS